MEHRQNAGLSRIILIVAATGSAAAQEKPEALRRLENQRGAIRTAHVEFSWQNHRDFDSPRYYSSRLANDDCILINRGDAEGEHRTSKGEVTALSGPRYTLKVGDDTWVREAELVGMFWPKGESAEKVWSLRSLGATYGHTFRDIHEALYYDNVSQPSPRRYRQTREGDLYVVAADTDYGTITWWIDSERGWNPVRVTLSQAGEVVSESRSSLRKFDDLWYPDTTAFFVKGYRNGREPLETVRVSGAYFNKPEQPLKLTPADIGIEAGFMVEEWSGDDVRLMFWDGSRLLTQQQAPGSDFQEGPSLQRAAAKREARQTQASRLPSRLDRAALESEWEAYTRKFIERFRLNAEQTQKALDVLKACQQQAAAYLDRHKDEFEKLDQRIKAAKAVTGEDAARQREALATEYTRMRAPVDAIFEKQLKPRLDKLPTRAQRRAAGEDKQPAKPEEPDKRETPEKP